MVLWIHNYNQKMRKKLTKMLVHFARKSICYFLHNAQKCEIYLFELLCYCSVMLTRVVHWCSCILKHIDWIWIWLKSQKIIGAVHHEKCSYNCNMRWCYNLVAYREYKSDYLKKIRPWVNASMSSIPACIAQELSS